MAAQRNRVVVVGGGFSGVAFALQAALDVNLPMAVTILEPGSDLGAGLAHSTKDPDHRLNAPAGVHYVLPEGRDQFHACFVNGGGAAADPASEAPPRGFFARRRDFAAHVSRLLQPHLVSSEDGHGIFHRRDRAIGLTEREGGLRVALESGATIDAQAVVMATGNRPARPPPPFCGAIQHHPAWIGTPWQPERLRAIPRDGRVLIFGTGLTTADMIATLVGQEHRGPIDAVSRRGLRPRSHRPPTGSPARPIWDRIFAPVPDFLTAVQGDTTMSDLLGIVRRRCHEIEDAGGTWHDAFDLMRDAAWQFWPLISAAEKRRFMRHLRPWYDTHRFRIAPPIENIVRAAEARGAVAFHAAKTLFAEPDGARLAVGLRDRGASLVRTERYDAVINCTGIDSGPGDDPLSVAVQADATMRAHPSGIGWDVDMDCRAIRGDGSVHRRLFVVGPPTAGVFGDPFGTPWIVAQIKRMIPAVRSTFD